MTQSPAQASDLVWHYTDAAGLLSILSSHTLWATSSYFLNDRQEVRLGGDLFADRLRRLAAESDDAWAEALAERMSDAREGGDLPIKSTFFILSASQSGDSLAMWRLYGGVKESYAIGLDPHADLAVLATGEEATTSEAQLGLTITDNRELLRRMMWKPVRYRAEEQQALVESVAEQIPPHLATMRDQRPNGRRTLGDLPPEVADLLTEITETMLLIKHEGFVDEREARMSFVLWRTPGTAIQSDIVRYRATAYGIAPYVAVTGAGASANLVTCQANRLPIKAVSISPSPSGVEAEISLESLLAARGYADVPVLRSAIPFRAG